MQVEYHILFPKIQKALDTNILSFSIEHMKCNSISIVYYVLHCYDLQGNEILIENKPYHIGKRWIVQDTYKSFVDETELNETQLHNIHKMQVELVMININDNNPLYFNHIMLQNKPYDGSFHTPDEAVEENNIGFNKNRYVNLYTNSSENYLQIIRPTGKLITTKKLVADEYTVLAPHLENEAEIDNPTNLLMEFYNQYDQDTNIFNDGFMM